MWSNYALALYRTLSRHRLYAALNVLGLALGVAVCAILLLVVRFEVSFDRWIPHADEIFRVNRLTNLPGRPSSDSPDTQALLLPNMLADFPQIRAGTRVMADQTVVRTGAQQAYESVALVDPSFFDVFQLPFVAGSPAGALGDTSSLVITQEMARKYFGTDQALGRTLTIVLDGIARNYRVVAVLRDLPANTHLKLGLIIRLAPEVLPKRVEQMRRWGSASPYTYVRLRSPTDAAAINAAFPAFVDRRVTTGWFSHPSRTLNYHLLPLASLHFHDAGTDEGFKPGADPLFVAALGVVGVVTLLIAIVNYMSLATAQAGMRAREVAVRKVMGATRRTLVVQFVAESVTVALGAGLIAAALTELALPGVSAVLGEPIRIRYFGADGAVAPLIALCVLVGLSAGLYPALVLSGFRPASVLASARTPGGGRLGARVREILAIFQFAVAITLMICTAVVFTQIQYLRNADLGFRRDGLIIVHGLGGEQVKAHSQAMVEAFRHLAGVLAVTASDRYPATGDENDSEFTRLDNPGVHPSLTIETVGRDYARTYGLHLIAGRFLGDEQRFDDFNKFRSSPPQSWQLNMMINETAARALGFPNPGAAVGRRLSFGVTDAGKPLIATIVGVIRDVRFLSPRRAALPQIYFQNTQLATGRDRADWSAAVRIRDGDRATVTHELEQIWRSMAPGSPFRAESVQAAMKPYYDPDARRGQLFAAGAVLAGLIACLGLYGLAAFNTTRRFKEIGIRKTLGASTRDVMRLLIGEFLRPVLIANLIAWPVAWFAMRAWLAGFDQRIALNPAYFIAPALIAVVVAAATVLQQTLRVSRAEPARALRYE